MLTLFAAAFLAQTAPDDVSAWGRDMFVAATCSSLGWTTNLDELPRVGQALEVAHPDMTEQDFEAVALQAAEANKEQVRAEIQAIVSKTGARAWLALMETRCEALAAARPALLQRTADPAIRDADLRSQFLAQYPD